MKPDKRTRRPPKTHDSEAEPEDEGAPPVKPSKSSTTTKQQERKIKRVKKATEEFKECRPKGGGSRPVKSKTASAKSQIELSPGPKGLQKKKSGAGDDNPTKTRRKKLTEQKHQELVETAINKRKTEAGDTDTSKKAPKRKAAKRTTKAEPEELKEEEESTETTRRSSKQPKKVVKTESSDPPVKKRKRLATGESVTDAGKKQKLNKEPKTRTKKATRKPSAKEKVKTEKGSSEDRVAAIKKEVNRDTGGVEIQKKMSKAVGVKAAKFVGAHMSVQGGLENAVKGAVETGAKAFALFLRSQRQWAAKPLEDKPAEKFRQACHEHDFPPHLILPHGSYLLNCGSPSDETLRKSREALADELNRCEKLGLTRYNFHPGSSCGQIPLEECLDKIGESINIVHQQTNKVMTVIENMSCQGNTVGGKFEELRGIIDRVKDKSRIGVCLDTCHAFAAGFDLASEAGYQDTMAEFDRIVGLKYLVAVHLNDSKGKVGSHLDRHEQIGKGQIGLGAFRRLMNDPRFDNIPLILETPVQDGMDYAKEIKLLNSLIKKP